MSNPEKIIGWDDPYKWHLKASQIVGEQGSTEAAQQGGDPKRIMAWDPPSRKWQHSASDIVREEAAAEAATDPKMIIRWHETPPSYWKLKASEIASEGGAETVKRTPLHWPEPWKIGAGEILAKEAAEGTQKTA